MVHTLYQGDVIAGEELPEGGDCKPLHSYRLKGPDGSYRIVLAGSEAEARAAAGMDKDKAKPKK